MSIYFITYMPNSADGTFRVGTVNFNAKIIEYETQVTLVVKVALNLKKFLNILYNFNLASTNISE